MKITYYQTIFEDHLTPIGYLPRSDMVAASACWRFCGLAMAALEKIPEQATYEGEIDKTVSLRDIAIGVANVYDVSLEDMFKYIRPCRMEAFRVNFFWDSRLDAWLATGGKSYDVLTRDPDKLNQT